MSAISFTPQKFPKFVLLSAFSRQLSAKIYIRYHESAPVSAFGARREADG